jgi:cyclohexa-1,5-dienecarbonyl-CoA hydratase
VVTGALRVEHRRHVTTIAFDAPPLNVLDVALLRDLAAAIGAAARDEESCALVLRGAGTLPFSAGVSLHDHRPERAAEMLAAMREAMRAWLLFPLPTIAGVRGICFGGGLEFVACADLVVADPSAVFACPEVKAGAFPPIAAARLRDKLPAAAAADLVFTGARLDAARAHALGLASRTGPLDAALEDLCDELRALSRHVLRASVRAFRLRRAEAMNAEIAALDEEYLRLAASADAREGVDAFFAKRRPRWEHR